MTKLSRLLIATHNEGKRKEIAQLLAPYVGEIVSAGQLNLPEPEETEDSFAGNAKLKALAGAKASGLLTLADDSGFGIDALRGKPGIYSARFAKTGQGHDYNFALSRLMQELGGNPDHAAHFICVLALARPDGDLQLIEGRCEGEVVFPGRGDYGFGYDPFFIPKGETRTFGEMQPAEKHALSHRGKALLKLIKFFAAPENRLWLDAKPQ